MARTREVLDFLPWALAIAVGCLVAAAVLLIPILSHARRAGRDSQSTITARNLLPLGADLTARVSDRVRDAVGQFDLPRDLRPEQMAALLHDGDPERAIAAALLDLQAAGVIDLDEDDRATVRRDADTSGLSDFQQRLLRCGSPGAATRVSSGATGALGALSQDVASRGWHTGRPDYVSYTPRLYAAFAGSTAAIMILFSTNLLLGGYWTYAIALYAAALLFLVLAWAFRSISPPSRRPLRARLDEPAVRPGRNGPNPPRQAWQSLVAQGNRRRGGGRARRRPGRGSPPPCAVRRSRARCSRRGP